MADRAGAGGWTQIIVGKASISPQRREKSGR